MYPVNYILTVKIIIKLQKYQLKYKDNILIILIAIKKTLNGLNRHQLHLTEL